MKVLNVVGARPNFMKMAPLIEALAARPDRFSQRLVHTGQHYDRALSEQFFDDLGMPRPDINLQIGSAGHAEQTGRIMMAFEPVCTAEAPDLVIVAGDVNSTVACALTAKKLGVRVAHVEAGLRSRDMTMPEEINRLCTDAISDYLFTTDAIADANLRAEGVAETRIFRVGNLMIDTLLRHRALAERLDLRDRLGLTAGGYAVATLHRPSNVDDRAVLQDVLSALAEIGRTLPVVLPLHPRTRQKIAEFGLQHLLDAGPPARGLWACEPFGYLEFLHLNAGARLVLTDSGGLQEETTVLGVPCLTLRANTERPITCEQGTNVLVGSDRAAILAASERALRARRGERRVPELWDGGAAARVVAALAALDR